MVTGLLTSAGLLALFQLSFPVLTPLAAEEAVSEVKSGRPESKMPPELGDAFEVPAGPKDAYGNSIRQGADEKTGLPLEIRHKATGMHFVFVPAGEFMMGSPEDEEGRDDDEKQHKVTLAKPFYMGKYEVTVGQFRAFVRGAGYPPDDLLARWPYFWFSTTWDAIEGRYWGKPGFEQTADHPVTLVSWNDAKAFCEWMSKGLSAKAGLPSEAQWEYACRAGSRARFFWGQDTMKAVDYANVLDETTAAKFSLGDYFFGKDGYVYTAPVGKFRPNDFGLRDMTGNVSEWCEDRYGDYDMVPTDATSAASDGTDASRVSRGGGWHVSQRNARCANRGRGTPLDRSRQIGFRVVVACGWLR